MLGGASEYGLASFYLLLSPVVIQAETRCCRLELQAMEATDRIIEHLLNDSVLSPQGAARTDPDDLDEPG